MSRLPRLKEFRFVGDRRTMLVYDCDDELELESLSDAVVSGDLIGNTLVQTFAPDSLTEARNRGFKPLARSR